MTKTIDDYAAAVSIDAANDYLLIEQAVGPVYKKISRNTIMGVSGTPADISTAQNITNKSLDNTNTITLKDTLFTLQDDGDTTKQARFQLSGITTATTRTYTLPNASVTLADTSSTQTFTTKTLTSPTITGGTIDNSTITVDSISGHTTPTIVTVGGVQMNNGTIGTAGAVITASIADTAVTPAKLQAGAGSGWAWQSFTPSWTNLTPGSGGGEFNTGFYVVTGKTITGQAQVLLGSSGGAVTGFITLTLPVTASSTYNFGGGLARIGNAQALISGTQYDCAILIASTTTCVVAPLNVASTYPTTTASSATVPAGWAAGSSLTMTFEYQAA